MENNESTGGMNYAKNENKQSGCKAFQSNRNRETEKK
jgi:hypothetical protein